MPENPVDKLRCAYQANGRQCRYPGTMSSSTLGEGPWYCHFHFAPGSPSYGAEVVKASQDYGTEDLVADARARLVRQANAESEAYCQANGLNTVEKMLTHTASKAPKIDQAGNLDWARKIMARIAAGESLPLISEQKARQALGLPSVADQRRAERDAIEAQFPAMQALR